MNTSKSKLKVALTNFGKAVKNAHSKQVKHHGVIKGTAVTVGIVIYATGVGIGALPNTVKQVLAKRA